MLEFSALTSIDRVTGLPELIRIDEKTSAHVSKKFEESWLARYPRPLLCCHDNGGEFNGWEFQSLLHQLGIKDVPTTSRNPASNGIVERMHNTVGDILRTYINGNEQARTLSDAKAIVDQALATASHAIRTNIHTTTGYSPGALAFRRDMLLDIPLVVDLTAIRDTRQVLSVNESYDVPMPNALHMIIKLDSKCSRNYMNLLNWVNVGTGHIRFSVYIAMVM